MQHRKVIDSFKGEHKFLSNFWECVVHYDGQAYPSSEHAYQAAKTLDEIEREWIKESHLPIVAKRRGKNIKIRKNWDWIKRRVMLEIVRDKFKNEELAKKLLATSGCELIENNTWGDTYWGVCDGEGNNYLGKILMRVRHEIRQLDRFEKVWMVWSR